VRVLLLGAGGQVGRAVTATAPRRHQVIAKTRAELDIADERTVQTLLGETKPDWIVNAAAYTAVDLAEDQPAQAWAINDTAVGTLAYGAAGAGSRLMHLSTDFVFDGRSGRAYLPRDAPQPLGVYGASKLGGETRVLQSGADGIVLRTAWVYAAAGRNFVLTMLKLMRERDEVRVVGDQIGAPTWATGLARAIWALLDAGAPGGIYHWTDLGVASWYDFAVAVQEEALERSLLAKAARIVPISSAEYPTRARRPTFSVLDSFATRALVAAPAAHWRHNLRMMLDELRAA
jgi:dTDP-4-dehydrorhamnose reductase